MSVKSWSHDAGSSAANAGDATSALIDEVWDDHLTWREACASVRHAYERWRAAARENQWLAHAAYIAALDQEEHAAACYERNLDRAAATLTAGSA